MIGSPIDPSQILCGGPFVYTVLPFMQKSSIVQNLIPRDGLEIKQGALVSWEMFCVAVSMSICGEQIIIFRKCPFLLKNDYLVISLWYPFRLLQTTNSEVEFTFHFSLANVQRTWRESSFQRSGFHHVMIVSPQRAPFIPTRAQVRPMIMLWPQNIVSVTVSWVRHFLLLLLRGLGVWTINYRGWSSRRSALIPCVQVKARVLWRELLFFQKKISELEHYTDA